MISRAFRSACPTYNQLSFELNADSCINKTNDESLQVDYIKNNLPYLTNEEIARGLNITFGRVRNLQRKYNCTRNQEQYLTLCKTIGKKYTGPNNPNYRGGISKNFLRYKKIQESRYPDHVYARKEARKALRKGIITKKNCEVCYEEKTEMHHEDYKKPLQIIFLCKKHHSEADKFLKEGIKFEEIKHELKNKKAI